MKIKEVQNTEVFIVNENNEIEEVNLCNFIMESVDETTTPHGVGSRFFVDEIIKDSFTEDELETALPYFNDLCYHSEAKDFPTWESDGNITFYTISSWGVGGNNYKKGTEFFSTEENAENELFDRIYKYDFLEDDQRNTQYFENYNEALVSWAEINEVDVNVAVSIFKHKELYKEIENKINIKKQKQKELLDKEYERQAITYSTLINKAPKENYRTTAKRLSEALNEKIPSKVFHKAVKIIRYR